MIWFHRLAHHSTTSTQVHPCTLGATTHQCTTPIVPPFLTHNPGEFRTTYLSATLTLILLGAPQAIFPGALPHPPFLVHPFSHSPGRSTLVRFPSERLEPRPQNKEQKFLPSPALWCQVHTICVFRLLLPTNLHVSERAASTGSWSHASPDARSVDPASRISAHTSHWALHSEMSVNI